MCFPLTWRRSATDDTQKTGDLSNFLDDSLHDGNFDRSFDVARGGRTARPAWDVWETPTLPEDLYRAEGV